ncbi:hypothetical protein AB0869_16865 [Micromonospora vinacea]|uniref:hypothetical protein n=1 Tax=Micromonospora vinacea TaxID=709878 RepID=UPI003451630E
MMTGEEELRGLVAGSAWLTRALTVVRDSGLPDAWIGAGALRDLVWGERYGDGFDPARVRDVDVARSRQRLARHRPAQRWPGVTVIEPG